MLRIPVKYGKEEIMVSSVGGYSASAAMATMAASRAQARPDTSQMASELFSKLDTKGQGYIEQSDLQSAFSQVFSDASSSTGSATDSSADSSALFKALDGDGNGKVTESEFSSGLQKLADALDSQAFSSRMGGAQDAGGAPPPPPPPPGADDTGLTKDQLQSQLDQIGSTDSARSSLISSVVQNFDKADTDGDGKVSQTEAIAYEQSTKTSTTAADGTGSSGSTTSQSDAALMHRVMELMRAYGAGDSTASTNPVLSVSS